MLWRYSVEIKPHWLILVLNLSPASGKMWACLATARTPAVFQSVSTGNSRKKHQLRQQRQPEPHPGVARIEHQQAVTWILSLGSWMSAWKCTQHSNLSTPVRCSHWYSSQDGHCKETIWWLETEEKKFHRQHAAQGIGRSQCTCISA